MMKVSFISVALVGLLAASVSGQSTITECIDDSTKIFDAEKLIEDASSATRTYILCTNTTFTTGSVIQEGASSDQFPLLPRSNMRILCGETGSSDGNCIFTGVSGVLSATVLQGGDNFFPQDNNVATNFYVSGVTFFNLSASIIFNDGTEGNWTFNDIIVRDNESVRHITLKSIFPAGDPNLFASTRVQFVGSQFLRNRILRDPGEGIVNFGDPAFNFLFYGPEPSTELIVENCVFDENNYSAPIAVDAIIEANPGWPRVASLYYGACLQRWRSNCFYNNYASRRAFIDSRFATPANQIDFTITNEDNYVLPGGGNQEDLRCPFIRQSFLVTEGNESSVVNDCINSTASECLADATDAPSASLSPSASPAPSAMPTLSEAPTTSRAPVTAAPTAMPTTPPTTKPTAASAAPSVGTPQTLSPVASTSAPTLVTFAPTPEPDSSATRLAPLMLLGGTVLAGWMIL